jgi:hypothetical protein
VKGGEEGMGDGDEDGDEEGDGEREKEKLDGTKKAIREKERPPSTRPPPPGAHHRHSDIVFATLISPTDRSARLS